MTDTVIMPQLGETVAEGKILAWFKSVGDEIREGDNLFEVETDKVTLEVQSIVAGRLDEIRVGGASWRKSATSSPSSAAGRGDAARAGGGRSAGDPPGAPERSPFEEVSTPTDDFGPAKGPDGVRVTPLARRLIAQNGLDLGMLAARARGGARRIDERAVRAAMRARSRRPGRRAAAPCRGERTCGPPGGEDIALMPFDHGQRTGSPKTGGGYRMCSRRSKSTLPRSIACAGSARTLHETQGFSLTYLPFIARATCLAILAFPQINARFAGKALSLSRE